MATDPEAGIYAREFDYLDCSVQLGVASGRLLSVSFPERPDPDAESDHELLTEIGRYLDGVEAVDFTDVEVALTVPTDQRAVLQTVRGIPYGQQVPVTKLAGMAPGLTDDDEGVATVRTALAENPTPLVIPDHRVRDGPSAAPPDVEQRLRSLEGL